MNIKEEDLYHPIRQFLEHNGYTVHAEVENCDITACKGDELVIIELKRSFSLKLVYQAIDRQKMSDSVYVAIPVLTESEYPKNIRQISRLLKRLEVGLILVHFLKTRQRVEILFHPDTCERRHSAIRRRAIIRESANRVMELNTGGQVARKRLTLYRQQAIEIAVCLSMLDSASPSELIKLGCAAKTQSILSKNFYGWFQRIQRGRYALHTNGREALASYPQLYEHFAGQYEPLINGKNDLCNNGKISI